MSLQFSPRRRTLLSLIGLGAGAGLLAACDASDTSGSDGITVVTTCYPLDFLASRVGGDRVAVTDYSTPGADAHGLELSVKQTLEMQEADLVLQIPGLQTAVDDAISSHGDDNVLDVSDAIEMLASSGDDEHDHADEDADADAGSSDDGGSEDDHDHDLAGTDPHIWHDPDRMAQIGDAIAERLTALDPDGADDYAAGAASLRTDLEALSAELEESFGAVDGDRTFITSHTAFAYLADRFDLHQVGITGVDPETEPSPQRLLQLEAIVEEEGVTTIFFETTASPKVAQTLADSIGVASEELDNLETQLSEDADYLQVMRENAAKLVASWS
ncbi:metal ABC transporter substrate-binding protein [Brachybacterium sp. DNPG3]